MADILERKKTHFVVCWPKLGAAPPVLVIMLKVNNSYHGALETFRCLNISHLSNS